MNIKDKVNVIIDGWGNYLKGSDPANLDLAKERAAICSDCPMAKYGLHTAVLPEYTISEIQGMYCSECRCPLSTAVRSKNYKCPKNKW